jgi:hypothetical protein
MTRWWDDSDTLERRIWRGLAVQEYGPEGASAFDYIAASKGWD